MIWLVRILSFLFLLVTLLPLLSSGKWYIRWWDFPRLQIAVLLLLLAVVWIVDIVWLRDGKPFSEPMTWVILLMLGFIWQSSHIVQFSLLYPKEVPDSVAEGNDRIRFMVANIDFENADQSDKVLQELKSVDADILLLVETNEKWITALKPLRTSYSHHYEHLKGEGLGLSLWSKFPILAQEKRHLVSDRRVSLWTEIEYLPGHRFHFIGVHPTPPGLMDSTGDSRRDSRVRDAELVMVAKEIAEKKNQSWVVAGDFNDVAWSHTTRLFKRISGLSDPRIGRSFMGTYIAQYPPCRCPIDHVFLSDGFSVESLSRTRISGSDHFAVIADVTFEQPHAGVDPEPDGNDHEEADKIIDEGKEEAEERGVAEHTRDEVSKDESNKINQKFRDATIFGDFDYVRTELAEHPELVHETDKFGFTALHEVVGEHHQKMAELLIEAGADVNAQNDEGIAPLHLAAYDYMVEVLLENGAKINLKSDLELTPLQVVTENHGGLGVMETLLENGADVNAMSPSGETALDAALERKETDKVELLRQYGAKAKH